MWDLATIVRMNKQASLEELEERLGSITADYYSKPIANPNHAQKVLAEMVRISGEILKIKSSQ